LGEEYMDTMLAGAMAAYVYLTNVQAVPPPEVFEYENLACTAGQRQGNEVHIGCGYIQVAGLPNPFDQFDVIAGVMTFGQGVIQESMPADRPPGLTDYRPLHDEPWSVV